MSEVTVISGHAELSLGIICFTTCFSVEFVIS